MIVTGQQFKKLLTDLNIRIHRHNERITIMDLETMSVLYPYEYKFDKADFKGNRIKEIEHLKENIFNGTNIDLVLKNKPYKRYAINIKNLSSRYCEKYQLNSFEAFDLLDTGDYTKTKLTFEYDKIKVYELKGYIDEYKNYVTTHIHYFEAGENFNGGYISLTDKTNPRLENNMYKIICQNCNDDYTVIDKRNDLENSYDIIGNSKYFNTFVNNLCPNVYQGYLKDKLEEEVFSILEK